MSDDDIRAALDDVFQFTDDVESSPRYVRRAWVEDLLTRRAADAKVAERDRIRNLGVNPVTGKCAYLAFATATRDSLNLPPWEKIPAEARVDWQMTADAVLMFATMETP